MAADRTFLKEAGIHPGSIVTVRPNEIIPKEPTLLRRPAVLLKNPDDDGLVKLAWISHTHPPGVKSDPSSDYGIDGLNGRISLDQPKLAHVSSDLRPSRLDPLSDPNLIKLKAKIDNNCGKPVCD
jgi:hypothetical protein